jgi:hypothetical protein
MFRDYYNSSRFAKLPAHVRPHPARVNDKNASSFAFQLVMDDVGLYVERRLGHAVAVPPFSTRLVDLSGFGRNIDEQLRLPAQQQRSHRSRRNSKRTERIYIKHGKHVGRVQPTVNVMLQIARDACVIDDDLEPVGPLGDGGAETDHAVVARHVQINRNQLLRILDR